MIKKRGMSSIIATLLIIMLTFIAVLIIWVVVKNLIVSQSEGVSLRKEFFNERVEMSVRINEPLVNISLIKIEGEKVNVTQKKNITIITEVVPTDVYSVVDLSGSMTQCIGVSSSCRTNIIHGTSYNSDNRIGYGADTDQGTNCLSAPGCSGSWYLIRGRSSGLFNGFSFDTTWASNSGITTNLADIGSNSAPAVFYKNNSLYLLSGESTGNFNGYIWDFLNWVPDSIINASLPDVGDYSTPAIFYKGANLYLISGNSAGTFNGFSWNIDHWEINFTVNASLPDIGSNSAPTVFYKGANLYLISGNSAGTFNGFIWNGTNWIVNSTIINNLADIGDRSTPYVFYKDSSLYMISGELSSAFNGYVWSVSQNRWNTNSTIISGLSTAGYSTPVVFYKNASWVDMLTPTKEANKQMAVSLLSASNQNRVGLVAYSTSFLDSESVDLTNNGALLNQTIDAWQPYTGTCICCGINEAADKLDLQSSEEKSKKIIVMSDGEAGQECPEQNTGDAITDATQSACDAVTLLGDLVVHAIGAGELVNEEALKNISICGEGNYYSAINISSLIEIYQQVVNAITSSSTAITNVNHIMIKFSNSTSSYIERVDRLNNQLVTVNYNFDLTGKLEGKLLKIEIYPVSITDSGKEIIGPLYASWKAD